MTNTPHLDAKEMKQPDFFVRQGRKVLELLVRSRERFIPVLVGILAVVAVAYGYDWWDHKQSEKSWDALHAAMEKTGDEKWKALDVYFVSARSGRSKFFAAVTLADHYLDDARKEFTSEKMDKAKIEAAANQSVSWYAKALETPGLLPTEKQLLTVNQGNSEEIAGRFDEALKTYEKASVIQSGEAKGLALISLARVYEQKQDKAKALESYDKVQIEFTSSEYGRMAKKAIRRLKSPLLSEDRT